MKSKTQNLKSKLVTRDRIKELRRVRASELLPNGRNWRRHPPAQHAALRGILAEVGYAAALLVRERDDGALEIIDGHLRAEITPDEIVPVLVLDVSAAEAAQILATVDTLGSLAQADRDQLRSLVNEFPFANNDVDSLFTPFLETPNSHKPSPQSDTFDAPSKSTPRLRVVTFAESYQVVATCNDESDQRALYERLTSEGYPCRLLML